MIRSQIPFNVYLLKLSAARLSGVRAVKVLESFDGITQNFHPDGLYSTTTFGRVGEEVRSKRYAYIDIKVPILHPVIYNLLIKLKRLYSGILAGTEYAIWDAKVKDFERSNPVDGETGYHFFMRHVRDIEFQDTKSDSREQAIAAIKKYREDSTTSKILLLPAGLRDMEIGHDGRITENEVNLLYRQLLQISNTISEAAIRENPEIVDRQRFKLQTTFNDIYALFERMVYGKSKLILGKWASRRIMNGTANVITSMDTSSPYLGQPGTIGFDNTAMGLFQCMKGLLPIALYRLKMGWLSRVFPSDTSPAVLINKKTLRAEYVQLDPKYFDRYQTNEGLEKVINSFREPAIRDRALEIEGRYLGLIYKGPDGTFKIIQDITELPAGRSPEHVYPLTFCELMYLCGYMDWNTYPAFITRYPITGVGSIYPSLTYVKTTTDSEIRRELGNNWEPLDDTHIAYEFPIAGVAYVKSTAPHPAKLGRLGADFDGDRTSSNFNYSLEAIEENKKYLQTKRAYVGSDGKFISSTNVSTVALTLHNLTSD